MLLFDLQCFCNYADSYLHIDCIITQPTYILIYIRYIIQSQYTIIYTREALGNLKIKTKMFDFEERVLIGWLAQSIVLIGWR